MFGRVLPLYGHSERERDFDPTFIPLPFFSSPGIIGQWTKTFLARLRPFNAAVERSLSALRIMSAACGRRRARTLLVLVRPDHPLCFLRGKQRFERLHRMGRALCLGEGANTGRLAHFQTESQNKATSNFCLPRQSPHARSAPRPTSCFIRVLFAPQFGICLALYSFLVESRASRRCLAGCVTSPLQKRATSFCSTPNEHKKCSCAAPARRLSSCLTRVIYKTPKSSFRLHATCATLSPSLPLSLSSSVTHSLLPFYSSPAFVLTRALPRI